MPEGHDDDDDDYGDDDDGVHLLASLSLLNHLAQLCSSLLCPHFISYENLLCFGKWKSD